MLPLSKQNKLSYAYKVSIYFKKMKFLIAASSSLNGKVGKQFIQTILRAKFWQ